jgi:hypothetical protein
MPGKSNLQRRAASAQAAGVSNTKKPASAVQPCAATKPRAYEPCELKDLTLKLNDAGNKKTATVVVAERKVKQPVAASVADDYVGSLGSYDLVMEAVTGVEFVDRTRPLNTDVRAVATKGQVFKPTTPAKDAPREGSPALEFKAKATHKAVHASFSPPHPRTRVGPKTEHSTAEVTFRMSTPPRTVGQNFLTIWPFSASRIERHAVSAHACGNSTAPNAVRELSILVIALPSEEWKISIKGPKVWGRSASSAYNRVKNSDGVGGVRTVTQSGSFLGNTGTYTDATGKNYSSQTLSTMTRGGFGEKITETTQGSTYRESHQLSERSDYLIGTRTYSITGSDSTETGRAFKEENEVKASGITITVKSAGEESSLDLSGIVDAIEAVKDIAKTIKEFFGSATVGWSVSAEISALEGALDLAWGIRWPEAYAEEDRVYYVERYITVTGDITLVQAKIEAKVGIEFEKSWAPVGFVAKAQLNMTVALKLSPSLDWKYTNPKKLTAGQRKDSIALAFSFAVVPEVVGSARAFGYSYKVRGAIETKFVATATMNMTWENPPELEVEIKSEKIELTGYLECSTRTPSRRGFDPILLCNEAVLYKNKNVWA